MFLSFWTLFNRISSSLPGPILGLPERQPWRVSDTDHVEHGSTAVVSRFGKDTGGVAWPSCVDHIESVDWTGTGQCATEEGGGGAIVRNGWEGSERKRSDCFGDHDDRVRSLRKEKSFSKKLTYLMKWKPCWVINNYCIELLNVCSMCKKIMKRISRNWRMRKREKVIYWRRSKRKVGRLYAKNVYIVVFVCLFESLEINIILMRRNWGWRWWGEAKRNCWWGRIYFW